MRHLLPFRDPFRSVGRGRFTESENHRGPVPVKYYFVAPSFETRIQIEIAGHRMLAEFVQFRAGFVDIPVAEIDVPFRRTVAFIDIRYPTFSDVQRPPDLTLAATMRKLIQQHIEPDIVYATPAAIQRHGFFHRLPRGPPLGTGFILIPAGKLMTIRHGDRKNRPFPLAYGHGGYRRRSRGQLALGIDDERYHMYAGAFPFGIYIK